MTTEQQCSELHNQGFNPNFLMRHVGEWECTLYTRDTKYHRPPRGNGPTMELSLNAALKNGEFILLQKKQKV